MASITSEFIIAYKDSFIDPESNSLCVIMEFAKNGDLQNLIN